MSSSAPPKPVAPVSCATGTFAAAAAELEISKLTLQPIVKIETQYKVSHSLCWGRSSDPLTSSDILLEDGLTTTGVRRYSSLSPSPASYGPLQVRSFRREYLLMDSLMAVAVHRFVRWTCGIPCRSLPSSGSSAVSYCLYVYHHIYRLLY